jgi:multidrug efflux pump subunit AcrA (membrane-fusion protein)
VLIGEARLASAEIGLEAATLALKRRQQERRDASFVAPFAGRLTEVAAASGQRVAAGERLATLIDPKALEVEFEVRAADFVRLLEPESGARLKHLPVSVQLDLRDRVVALPGRLERVGAVVRPQHSGRTLLARLEVGDGSPLLPGDFVTVTIEEPSRGDVGPCRPMP